MDSRNKDAGVLKGWFRNWFRPQPKNNETKKDKCGKPPPDIPKNVVWPLNEDLPQMRPKKVVVSSNKDEFERYPPCRRSTSYDHIRDCIGVPEPKTRPKSAAGNKDDRLHKTTEKSKRSYLVDHSLAQQLTRTSTKNEIETKKPLVSLSKLNLSPIKEYQKGGTSVVPIKTRVAPTRPKLPEYPFAIHPYHDAYEPQAIPVAPSNVPNAKEAYKMWKKMREENSILGDDEMSFVTTYSQLAAKNQQKLINKMNADKLKEKLRVIENQQLVLSHDATTRTQIRKPAKPKPVLVSKPKKVTILTPSRDNNRPALVPLQNRDQIVPAKSNFGNRRNSLPKYSKPPERPPEIERVAEKDCRVNAPIVKSAIANVKSIVEREETNPKTSAKNENDDKLRYGIGYTENRKPILWYDAEDLDSSLVVDVVNCEHRINLSKLVERSVQLNLERILSKNGLPWHGSPPKTKSKPDSEKSIIKKDVAVKSTTLQERVYENVSELRAHSRCSQDEARGASRRDTLHQHSGGEGQKRKAHRRTSSLPCLSEFVRTLLDPRPLINATGTELKENLRHGEATDIGNEASSLISPTNLQDTLPLGLLSASDLSLLITNYHSAISRLSASGVGKMSTTTSKSPVKRIVCKPRGKEVVLGKSKIKLTISLAHNKLIVNVIRAVHLLPGPANSLLANAYVKVSLAPDKSQLLNWRSKITKSTNNPFWGFEISIPISAEMLKMRLVISVWNRESNKKRSEFLGCATFRMENFLQKGFAIRGWYRILSFAPMTSRKIMSGSTMETTVDGKNNSNALASAISAKKDSIYGTATPIISDSWLI